MDVAFSRDQAAEDLRATAPQGSRQGIVRLAVERRLSICVRRRDGHGAGRERRVARRRGGRTAAWTPTMPRPGWPISPLTDGICAMSTEVLERPAAYLRARLRAQPESAVEIIKKASRGLRGTLVESLHDPLTGAIRESDTQLIKFHGSYMQDDRDLRAEREHQKLEPAYSFMIRTRLPGGVVTPKQWLALSEPRAHPCDRHAAPDHAPGLPGARRHQERSQEDHAGDERRADRFHRRLR